MKVLFRTNMTAVAYHAPLLPPEEHLADITHVPDLRVAEAEFPAMLLAVCPF